MNYRCNKVLYFNIMQFEIICVFGHPGHICMSSFAMQNWVRQIGIKALTNCRTINLVRNGRSLGSYLLYFVVFNLL
jgi:hypothetical protein